MIYTRRVQYHTQFDFDRHECDYNTHECDFNTHKIVMWHLKKYYIPSSSSDIDLRMQIIKLHKIK
jgi:hypothetical protein